LAVIYHLKHDGVSLPNEQIKKLVAYVARVVEPYAEEYRIR